MTTIVRLIRNDPPKYPWEGTARQELVRKIDPRWRAYCLTQAAAAVLNALASTTMPSGTRKDRRESCVVNLRRGRDYLNMAAKRWAA